MYTGIATDVSRRFAEHKQNNDKGAKYLRGRGPLQLVFQKVVGARGLALRVEGKIKKLPKTRKEELIEQDDKIEQIISQAMSHRITLLKRRLPESSLGNSSTPVVSVVW